MVLGTGRPVEQSWIYHIYIYLNPLVYPSLVNIMTLTGFTFEFSIIVIF